MRAAQAAGVIHTDFEKHFIRAEVVPFQTLAEAGSLAACRTRGTLRLEGRDYVVLDGDVINFRVSA
jgi:ribosome-binding ATPase YchF (GTP1/OBG family)